MRELRAGLPLLPARIAALPIDERGYPVPWFVAWIDGAPDFRIIGPGKLSAAHSRKLCWICGQPLGRNFAFVAGPMCGVNRVSAEPPNHADCATFAAIACPFLVRPMAKRREINMADTIRPDGMIDRNPGVAMVWHARDYERFRAGDSVLIRMGHATSVDWYCQGRRATKAEIMASIESGMPLLAAQAEKQGIPPHVLAQDVAAVMRLLPA